MSPDRRASWVALRTLRQRPKVVDHTAAGEPIYEVQSVRLVLREDDSHFNRLVKCSRCGNEVVGSHVHTAADLKPSHSVICKDCSQFATRPAERAIRPDPPAPPPPVVAPVEAVAVPVSHTVDSRRMAAVEGQLRVLTNRVASVGKESAARAAELEGHLRKSVGELAEQVQNERTERAAVNAALAEMRADMDRIAQSGRELARGQLDLTRGLTELAEQTSALPASEAVADVVDQRIRLVTNGIERSMDVALTEGLAQARAQGTAREDQLREEMMALELAVTQRNDVTGQALQELHSARDRLEERLDDLATQVADGQARVDALTSSLDATVSQFHVREQTLSESVKRLTGLLEDRMDALDAGTATSAPAPASGGGHPGSGGLLDSLERQLRNAERRMAQHTIRSASGDMIAEESLKS